MDFKVSVKHTTMPDIRNRVFNGVKGGCAEIDTASIFSIYNVQFIQQGRSSL